MAGPILLRVLTPAGVRSEVGCDDAVFIAADDPSGHGGGSVGIRRGHMPAVIALAENSVFKAYNAGKCVLEALVTKGVAEVKNDVITVVAESVTEQ